MDILYISAKAKQKMARYCEQELLDYVLQDFSKTGTIIEKPEDEHSNCWIIDNYLSQPTIDIRCKLAVILSLGAIIGTIQVGDRQAIGDVNALCMFKKLDMISQEDFEWFTEAFFFISLGRYSKFGLSKGQVVMRYNIMKDSVCWNEEFKYHLNMICSEAFINANLAFFDDRIFDTESDLCLIDITNYIRTKDNVKTINKVRFCVSWLNTFQLRKDGFSCQGIVHVDGKDFDCMQHTDFTSYMQSIGIITLEEHIEINKDWLDPTGDEPYYL